MKYNFYRAFEDRYRGSRETIKGRLKVYMPIVKSIKNNLPQGMALDLGCGRGEWLELLTEQGLQAKGIDLDADMLDACKQTGLNVEEADAIDYITKLPDDSQAVISAFHLVEHITTDQIRLLAGEALRTLKPGGVLILETPNPENIYVATVGFYLDPTHQRPIPPALLEFIVEYAGFETIKTIRLQEAESLEQKQTITTKDVIFGSSPDYAIIAQKTGSTKIKDSLDKLTNPPIGISLEKMVDRFDVEFKNKINNITSRIIEIEAYASEAKESAHSAKSIAQQAESRAQQAESRSQQAENHIIELTNSRSWRITAPLRGAGRLVRRLLRK